MRARAQPHRDSTQRTGAGSWGERGQQGGWGADLWQADLQFGLAQGPCKSRRDILATKHQATRAHCRRRERMPECAVRQSCPSCQQQQKYMQMGAGGARGGGGPGKPTRQAQLGDWLDKGAWVAKQKRAGWQTCVSRARGTHTTGLWHAGGQASPGSTRTPQWHAWACCIPILGHPRRQRVQAARGARQGWQQGRPCGHSSGCCFWVGGNY